MTQTGRLKQVMNKNSRTIIGLMSGMSYDGVDLALVRIAGEFPDLQIDLLDSDYEPYLPELKSRLKANEQLSAQDVCELDFLIAEAFADTVNTFVRKREIDRNTIDAIGSHGQTLVHIPPGSARTPSTLQVGSGSVIAERTGILTVFNFRPKDMAAGGQGAPLVPLLDYLLYRKPDEVVSLNNLGSISNVTIVAPDIEDVRAFDTGPANMPIDHFASQIPGNDSGIDKSGKYSAQGKVISGLLHELLALPFFKQEPPKSAGYEQFGPMVLSQLAAHYPDANREDLVRTAVEFSAITIADAYNRFVLNRHARLKKAIFTGGGIHNPLLMQRIRELLPDLSIETPKEENFYFSDAKEAIAMAVLANETLSGRPGNLPKVTGAKRPLILGEIAFP